MSRLDQHVAAVQNKLALNQFLQGLAKALVAFAAAVWLAILIDRIFQLRLPRVDLWFWGALAAAGVAGIVYGILRRPTEQDAAVQIDTVLQTKDKFATALHFRTMNDPFAHAAVLDAERHAQDVSLNKRFPLGFPKATYIAIAVALLALATHQWLSPMDLFGKKQQIKKLADAQAKQEMAKRELNSALATVNAIQAQMPNNEAIKVAKEGIVQQLNKGTDDPDRARRTAAKALQDVNEALKETIKKNQTFAQAENDAKMLRQIQPSTEAGPVAEAQRELAKGNFQNAVNEIQKAVENFDKMEKKDQEKAADQMKQMANQLQQMAKNPEMQKQMQQQLQQMGANQQQAQQMAQQMQKAAQGDKQAQQQLQQMAQQLAKQMNNGQGPNPQQQQQIQQMMQQMQAQANGQQQAHQLQQAAQQMAQAMQQQAQQQGQNQGQQGQNQQQQQQGQQQAKQQMGQGMQQMQQQLQQMQAQAQDAQQVAAAQQAAQNAAEQAMNGQAGNQPQGQAGEAGQGGQNGQNPGGGDPNQPWNGQANNGLQPNNGGVGAGDRTGKQQAPFDIKPEIDPSQNDDKGKVLAVTLVKDSALKGESKAQLKEIAESAVKNQSEEIDQDRISRQAQKVVREYFNAVQKDAEANPPTTAPSN